MSSAAASPVSEGVLTALLASTALVAAAVGGIHDDVPQTPSYPFVWYEIFHEVDRRGFGTGELPELELRVHTFSQYAGKAEAQEVNRLAIAALKDQALTITGYTQCSKVFYDDSLLVSDVELRGVKVHEIVSFFRIFAEAA